MALQYKYATLFTTDMTVESSVTSPADEVKTSGVEAAANDANKRLKLEQENPLLRSWSDQPFSLPPFKDIKTSHFEPALKAGMESHIADLKAIAKSESTTFDHILGKYDRAGALLSKVSSVYYNYTSSLNTPDFQKVQSAMAPILSRHNSKCYDIPGLFEKIEKLYDMKDEKLKSGEWTAEQARLAERVYIKFVRMGAKFDDAKKKEYADIQGTCI